MDEFVRQWFMPEGIAESSPMVIVLCGVDNVEVSNSHCDSFVDMSWRQVLEACCKRHLLLHDECMFQGATIRKTIEL